MLYAVVDQGGELIARDLTTDQAARAILTVDSQEYEIRPSGAYRDYWTLWTRQQVANKPWTETLMGTYGVEYEARAAIFARVVKEADGGRWWKAEAMPQADYDAMISQAEAEADE
jgi:hypothetical protein